MLEVIGILSVDPSIADNDSTDDDLYVFFFLLLLLCLGVFNLIHLGLCIND